jgi:hypothetical protein
MGFSFLISTRMENHMSKIALPIAELKPALTGLGKVVNRRSTLPVLSHLKVEQTKEGWIAITGTDLLSFVTYRLEQPGDGEPLSLLVPYDELLKITKSSTKADSLLVSGDEWKNFGTFGSDCRNPSQRSNRGWLMILDLGCPQMGESNTVLKPRWVMSDTQLTFFSAQDATMTRSGCYKASSHPAQETFGCMESLHEYISKGKTPKRRSQHHVKP